MTLLRIAVPQPTSFDQQYNRACWPQYAAAIRTAGGEAIEIGLALSPAEMIQLIGTCCGVLLPGSPADVNPEKYGHPMESFTAPPDPQRENADELLLQDAHNLYKPILGVCYGAQSLNVWRGGSLLQHLPIIPINHEAGPSVAIAHTVSVEPRSVFKELALKANEVNKDQRVYVNSSHHQAIGIPGDGLHPTALSSQDGVIEAVEGGLDSTHFVFGVQWHPERSVEISATSRAIFKLFVERCAAWIPRRVETSVSA